MRRSSRTAAARQENHPKPPPGQPMTTMEPAVIVVGGATSPPKGPRGLRPSLFRRMLVPAAGVWAVAMFALLVFFWSRGAHPLGHGGEPVVVVPPLGGGGDGGGGGSSATATPSVTLRQGVYAGVVVPSGGADGPPRDVDAFLGVPYARPPVGESRFRPPVAVEASEEAFSAAAMGPACAGGGGRSESEDCLFANVYRPRGYDKSEKKMPVAVYIHGGAFNGGGGGERNMATFVAWADRDIVGVSFNYRVGALGFLPSGLTAREGLLNLGLRDQQMLLDWVKENIAAFGGDEENVTVMGLSAGAHSLGHHLMHYAKTDAAPFHKAILESGGTTARAVFLPTHPRHLVQFREFLVAAGVEGVPEAELFAALRKLPLATVVGASRAVYKKYDAAVCWPFQPVVDGVVLAEGDSDGGGGGSGKPLVPSKLTDDPMIPDLPLTSWRTGHHLRIPILTGFNTNEGAIFVPRTANTDASFRVFFTTLLPSFTASDIDALSALYPDPAAKNNNNTSSTSSTSSSPYALPPAQSKALGAQFARLDAAYAHYAYICPVLQSADFMAAADGGSVRVYRYAARATAQNTSNHGDHQPVVAHDAARLGGAPGLARVADAMHGAWVRFVASSRAGEMGAGEDLWAAAGGDGEEDARGDGSSSGGGGGAEEEEEGRWRKRKIVVFGEGNDERVPGGTGSEGTPVGVERLAEDIEEKCRFWWDRVELSEGMGRRGEVDGSSRA